MIRRLFRLALEEILNALPEQKLAPVIIPESLRPPAGPESPLPEVFAAEETGDPALEELRVLNLSRQRLENLLVATTRENERLRQEVERLGGTERQCPTCGKGYKGAQHSCEVKTIPPRNYDYEDSHL